MMKIAEFKIAEPPTAEPAAQVREWLLSWFVDRSKLRPETLSQKPAAASGDAICDRDYFDAGWLTSMEVVEFVTEIESRFAMQFSDEDLQDPRFVTINGLAHLILAHAAA